MVFDIRKSLERDCVNCPLSRQQYHWDHAGIFAEEIKAGARFSNPALALRAGAAPQKNIPCPCVNSFRALKRVQPVPGRSARYLRLRGAVPSIERLQTIVVTVWRKEPPR